MTTMQQSTSAPNKPSKSNGKGTLKFQHLGLAVRVLLGLLLTFLAAVVCAKLFVHSSLRQYVPLGFVVVLVVIAARFGAIASLLAAILAVLVFAYSLYPPLGSLGVADGSARESLSWMLLTTLVISFLLFPPKRPT